MQTLNYRAPEILWGSNALEAVADSWSLGLMLLELGGMTFHRQSQSASYTKRDYAIALFRHLGTPSEPSLARWPTFQEEWTWNWTIPCRITSMLTVCKTRHGAGQNPT